MEKIWILLIVTTLFSTLTFLYWKLTYAYAEKQYGKKMFTQWGTRTFYWSGALLICGGITVLVVCFLKWVNILTL